MSYKKIILICICFVTFQSSHADNNSAFKKVDAYAGVLFLKPQSDNLKYAVFVSGTQPYYQSWHYQAINPKYAPAFNLGLDAFFANQELGLSHINIDWLHLGSHDTASKQASEGTDLQTIEFVGPVYEMSPPVFAIKRVNARVDVGFDSILLNINKHFQGSSRLKGNFFGGLNILRVNQTLSIIFSDNVGVPRTFYSYALPPDPSFSFKTENVSKYWGVGPDLGLDVQYKFFDHNNKNSFGGIGRVLGTVTVGSISAQDNFTSTAARLTENGVGTSRQEITAPDATQVVPGLDGKLGLYYNYHNENLPEITLEIGYRIAAYLNAISTISPNTLVQPGDHRSTPEFATGTMAIVSTDARSRPFNFNGPYLNLKVVMA
ncbi:MAG: Lpg1974 family pore-forming outer membrane protein [Legionella sp.]|nr:Lpg1974 family pore-forming outer membrane protein [Legionella sp.]